MGTVPLQVISRSRGSMLINPIVNPLAHAAPNTQRMARERDHQFLLFWNVAKPASFFSGASGLPPSVSTDCLAAWGGRVGGGRRFVSSSSSFSLPFSCSCLAGAGGGERARQRAAGEEEEEEPWASRVCVMCEVGWVGGGGGGSYLLTRKTYRQAMLHPSFLLLAAVALASW